MSSVMAIQKSFRWSLKTPKRLFDRFSLDHDKPRMKLTTNSDMRAKQAIRNFYATALRFEWDNSA